MMTAEQRGEAMRLASEWALRPSADMRPGEVAAIGNRMAELLRKLATTYPSTKPVMWMHQDNPQLTTQREPLGPGWVALYREAPQAALSPMLDARGSLGEPIV